MNVTAVCTVSFYKRHLLSVWDKERFLRVSPPTSSRLVKQTRALWEKESRKSEARKSYRALHVAIISLVKN